MSKLIYTPKNNLKNEPKKAVIYCRVSTKEQADEGNSLVSQERICREYAAKEGYEIVQVFIERGESAKTADRTQLKLLMKLCTSKKGLIQVVIAYKVDRISRNIADYSVIRGTLKRYGIEIKSVTEFFEDTPAGRFMENIIANVGQFDNDVRAERCLGGMREATAEGRYVWKGPIGYDNVKINGKSTIAPNALAPFVLRAFELVAMRFHSTSAVRLLIAKEGLVNPKGEPVSQSNFFWLLRNPLYKGVIKKFGQEYPGTFEAIVPAELFDKVQIILENRKNSLTHYLHDNPDFPLRGFLRNEAGRKITGYWAQGRRKPYPYYSYKLPNTIIRKEILEQRFINFLGRYELDERHLHRMQYHLKKQLAKQSQEQVEERKDIEKKVIDINKWIDALITLQDRGGISIITFTERVQRLETELEQLKDLLKTRTDKVYDIDDLMSFAEIAIKEPQTIWRKSPYDIQKKLQVFDFPEGVVFDGINCRTTKVCNLFRLKSAINHEIMSRVDSAKKFTNTPKRRISQIPVDFIHTKAYWETIAEELLLLKTILTDEILTSSKTLNGDSGGLV